MSSSALLTKPSARPGVDKWGGVRGSERRGGYHIWRKQNMIKSNMVYIRTGSHTNAALDI